MKEVEQEFDLHWIVPDLAIGACPSEACIENLVETKNLKRIIDLRAEASNNQLHLDSLGVRHLRLPTPDMHPVSMADLFSGVKFASDAFEQKESLLVHCQYGIGRSALLVACILISRGFEALNALKHIKEIRAKVSPSPQQLNALLEWADLWSCATNRRLKKFSLEELQAIAYSHLSG